MKNLNDRYNPGDTTIYTDPETGTTYLEIQEEGKDVSVYEAEEAGDGYIITINGIRYYFE